MSVCGTSFCFRLLLKDMESWGLQVRWLIWLLAMLGISYQYMFHERYVFNTKCHYINATLQANYCNTWMRLMYRDRSTHCSTIEENNVTSISITITKDIRKPKY